MELKWTKEQLEAVTADVSNILVTAAAGSGKTQVLSGRIVNRIVNGADISKILVVTFTKSAAAQMRARITQALTDYLREHPENAHIRKQLSYLPSASITTMHSFCLNVVLSNFFEAGLKASVRVGDDTEIKILKLEAAEQSLEELYAEGNPDFLHFSDLLSGSRDDSNLTEYMLSLYHFTENMPYPERWLDSARVVYEVENAGDYKKSMFCNKLIQDAEQKLLRAKLLCSDAYYLSSRSGFESYGIMIKEDEAFLDSCLAQCRDWDKLSEALTNVKFRKRPPLKTDREDIKEAIASLRDSYIKIIKDLAVDFAYSGETCAELIKKTYPLVNGLIVFTRKFKEVYTALKLEKNVLDYDDFEHICSSLLEKDGKSSDIAKSLREKYDEIYIDEYQDSNPSQELIYSLVSRIFEGQPNIFMVGDIKQSIYAFRQSSPDLFLKKKKSYKTGAGEAYRKILLNKNFRSSASVIDFVNFVFEKLMSEKTGNVDYDEEERLVCGSEYPELKIPELNLIDLSEVSDSRTALKGTDAQAAFISKRINEIVGRETVYDAKEGKTRTATYSDIVILLRSPRNSASVFEKALADNGIPFFSDSSGGYFESTEVKTFICLLEIIDNPQNDIPLISVMRSPIFAFTEDELAGIRVYDKKALFYNCVKKCSGGTSGLSQKCRGFLQRLSVWRKKAQHDSCDELIEFLFEDTGFLQFVTAQPRGEARAANLRLLFEKARSFEQSSFRGLFNFINFLDKMQAKGEDFGEAKLIGSNNDVVRIMSIHKSKGLEFPIVFLAYADKSFHGIDAKEKFLMHRDFGIAAPSMDLSMRTWCETPVYASVKQRLEEDALAEEMRVLYVALTRAKEKIIIVGAVKNLEKEKKDWEEKARLIKKGIRIAPSSFLECICVCAASDKRGFENNPYMQINIIPNSFEDTDAVSLPQEENAHAAPNPEIYDVLSYEYPHRNLWHIPSKVSVTELKRLRNMGFDSESFEILKSTDIKKPRFIEQSGYMSAAERGTLTHFIMQTIDPCFSTIDEVRAFVQSLVSRNIITKEEAANVACEKILSFLVSPLGERIRRADRVFREEPFTMLVPASFVTGNKSEYDEKIIVQGIIDCFFLEGDRITLLDFKTDKTDDLQAIKERYRTQMDLYAAALEKKFFTKVYEKFIYLFDNGGIIRYDV